MDTKEFLELVSGKNGHHCIHCTKPDPGATDKKKKIVRQKHFESLDEAIDYAFKLDAEGFDSFFALGTTDGTSRKVTSIQTLKSFFIDLDCGEGKPHKNQVEGLAAIKSFCKELNLPRPTIINSGRGLHIYWPLVDEVDRDVWLPISYAFKHRCLEFKLDPDPTVSADAARVLRVLLTHNHKVDPPAQVTLLGKLSTPVEFRDFSELILRGEDISKFQPALPSVGKDPLTDILAGNSINRFKTILEKTLRDKGCEQIRNILVNQEAISEPLWRAGLSIANHCEDRDKAIHKISSKHPEYNPHETEEKAALTKGPYLCSSFNDLNKGVCTDCPHWGKIKSPIVLGKEILEASEEDSVVVQKVADEPYIPAHAYVIPKLPAPYFRGKTGGVYKRVTDGDETKDLLIYHNDLYVVGRLRDPEAGESVLMRLHLPKDGVREFTIPLSVVGTKDEFRKMLNQQGVTKINSTELMNYTMTWVNELQIKSEAAEAHRQFGWTDDEGSSFVLGNLHIHKNDIQLNPTSRKTRSAMAAFKCGGTLEGWKETINFYNRPGMELHQFMVGLSFGSILMNFQPINAAAFHVYSKESGLGKTTALLAAASVWGDPDEVMLKDRDTMNMKMNRVEVYKNIFVPIDELTNTLPKELSDYAYQLTSGSQRGRLGRDGNMERIRGKPWKTLFASTGNASIIERISMYKSLPQAEAERILEYQASPVLFGDKSETDVFSSEIKKHYGHAGIKYVQHVIQNKNKCVDLAASTQRKLDSAAGLTAVNRFFSVLISHGISGLIIAKDVGLISWDIAPVVKFSLSMVDSAVNATKEMKVDAESLLVGYLAENWNNMLRIKSTLDGRKLEAGIPNTDDRLIIPDATPRLMFIGRYEYDIKKLYLLPKPFKEWCSKQQLHYNGVIAELKNGRAKARKEKVRLGKGTHMNWPPVDTLAIDCSGFMNDETEKTLVTNANLFGGAAEAS